MTQFQYADLHCHPNLKTFGHSFDRKSSSRSSVWHYQPPKLSSKFLNVLLGLTRFSQADFTTLHKGRAKIICASLYPFEKGFFINRAGKGAFSAWLSNHITGIGYHRVRHLQQHLDYFKDLTEEYKFLRASSKEKQINGQDLGWRLVGDKKQLEACLKSAQEIAVVLSIEGAHVFNTGLADYGRAAVEAEVISNIKTVKQWEYPPVYITFAHNFNNELCGHAESLDPIKFAVDQSKAMDTGFTPLGEEALLELLCTDHGPRVLIDIKHMSLQSRLDYFEILNTHFGEALPPSIVSHGAVTGRSIKGTSKEPGLFYDAPINFYDEELIHLGKTGGLFALQFDMRRIAHPGLLKKEFRSLFTQPDPAIAAAVIWQQIRYVAELLDQNELFAWGMLCIGSDFDGTINPLPGIWTAEYIPLLYEPLLEEANAYLKGANPLRLGINKSITPEELLQRFFIKNTEHFFKANLQGVAQ